MNFVRNLAHKPPTDKQRKALTLILVATVIVQFLLIFYFQREIFTQKYDVVYWNERFEYSQWSLPLSTRPIGDDALFAYIGYRLIHGMDPTLINVETPPVGKYLIGISILLFKNAAIYGLIATVSAFILSFVLFAKILKDKLDSFLLTVIVFLDPLLFSQSWLSLLDMIQLVFLLINFLAIFLFIKKNKFLYSTVAGISLGLFFGIKFPIIFPIIFTIESIYFIYSKKYLKFLVFLISLIVAILTPYLKFFVLGNSLLDFLRIEKFIVNFYSSSTLEVNIGAIWSVILTGKFPDLVSGSLGKVSEWSLIWPIILILSFFSLRPIIKKKKFFLLSIFIYVFGTLVIFTFIPFYPRYFVIVLPFLYVLSFFFIRTYTKNLIIFLPVIFFCFVNFYTYINPNPNHTLDPFFTNLSNQNFQDIYLQNLSSEKPTNTRNEFQKISKDSLRSANIEYVTIKITNKEKISKDKMKIDVAARYYTRFLGEFSENKSFYIVKENSKWKVIWNWDLILNDYKPEYFTDTSRVAGKRGSIIGKNGNILAEDVTGYTFSVNPSEYEALKEDEMLGLLSSVIEQDKIELQDAYLNEEKNNYIDIGTNFKPVSEKNLNMLRSYKGLQIRKSPARIYYELRSTMIANKSYPECCSRIYSSSSFQGVDDLEKKYEYKLKGNDGGALEIKDKNGNVIRKVFEREKKDGEDVKL